MCAHIQLVAEQNRWHAAAHHSNLPHAQRTIPPAHTQAQAKLKLPNDTPPPPPLPALLLLLLLASPLCEVLASVLLALLLRPLLPPAELPSVSAHGVSVSAWNGLLFLS